MDLPAKLAILADAAKYDASCASSGARRSTPKGGVGNASGMGICHSYTPDGRCVSLLKILLTNYCLYDCLFCVNRVSSDVPRARFTPEEVVTLTLDFYKRNYIEGLFLSSAIFGSPDATMEALIRVARSLRQEHRFGGYIHLKVIPGAAPGLLREAGRWADRLSANIELPTQRDLDALAPEKTMAEIERTMDDIREGVDESRSARNAPKYAPAGQTTQMVVGATAAPDAEILATASSLYKTQRLRRIYYSAFSPFPKSDVRLPLEAPPLVREHRLYQADWLMRFYGFEARELTTDTNQNLDLDRDPKLSWALRNRGFFPVDVNRAPREALLRIPGVGYRNARAILSARRHRRLSLDDLRKLHVVVRRARPFLITADHNPAVRLLDSAALATRVEPEQMPLFGAPRSVWSGEL